MTVEGSHTIAVPPERAYQLLLDPKILAQCMPGCDELVTTAPGEYQMKMKVTLASLAGLFSGKVRISDENPPHSYRMVVDGTGKIGFVRGEGLIELSPAETGTLITYKGQAQVGGTIAAVGSRLVDTTSRMMIRKFFERLADLAAKS